MRKYVEVTLSKFAPCESTLKLRSVSSLRAKARVVTDVLELNPFMNPPNLHELTQVCRSASDRAAAPTLVLRPVHIWWEMDVSVGAAARHRRGEAEVTLSNSDIHLFLE